MPIKKTSSKSSVKTKQSSATSFISVAPKESQVYLRKIIALLRKAAPKSTEGIKWGSYAFSYKRILFTCAGFKQHIGFYPTPAAMKPFKKELAKYKTGAGSIQFPLDASLPAGLILKIAKFRVKESKEKDVRWM